MTRYNYLQAFYMSFYSRSLYRDVAINWRAGTALYLFLLLLVCWAAMMVKYQPLINNSFRGFVNEVTPQIPPMSIKEGILSTPEKKPYLIKDPDNNNVIAIIDTSGQYTNMEQVPEGTVLLATQDTTYYMDNRKTVRVNKNSKNLNLDIVPEKIKEVANKFIGWLWILLLPILLIMSFIYRLVQALVYGLIGKIFASMANVPLNFSQTFRLSMIAVTPAIVFATIIDFFNIAFVLEWLVCFLIAMVYLIFAINSNKPSNNPELV